MKYTVYLKNANCDLPATNLKIEARNNEEAMASVHQILALYEKDVIDYKCFKNNILTVKYSRNKKEVL